MSLMLYTRRSLSANLGPKQGGLFGELTHGQLHVPAVSPQKFLESLKFVTQEGFQT